MRQSTLLILSALLTWVSPVVAEQIEPPRNPYLADSPWPITHANSYVQGSSSLPGLTKDCKFALDQVRSEPVTVTLAYGPADCNGRRAIWGNTLKHVYKIDANGNSWKYADRKYRHQTIRDGMSGAYTLVDCDGTFFIPRDDKIEAYTHACRDNCISDIRKSGEVCLPKCGVPWAKGEMIVGLNMTYDGWLTIVTSHARVAVVRRDLKQIRYLCLKGNQRVSNSIAVDEDGGIYVVTSTTMHRIQWDGCRLSVCWAVPYKSTGEHYTGRFGEGSGTTPTLMGVGDQDKFVVIGDGQRVMHMLLMWRDEIPDDWAGLEGYDRRVAAAMPMHFGRCNPSKSSTEQSILVSGYGAFVVSNDYGQKRQGVQYTGIVDKFRILISNKEEIAPHGIEKFRWNPESRQLERAWSRRCLSCPNAIPTMSRATQLIYFIGARDEVWNLEAVDWNTGESAFYIPIGKRQKFNSYYAATQIGLNGEIVTGAFRSLLRLRNKE